MIMMIILLKIVIETGGPLGASESALSVTNFPPLVKTMVVSSCAIIAATHAHVSIDLLYYIFIYIAIHKSDSRL